MSFYEVFVGSDKYRTRLDEILGLCNYDTGRERDIYVCNYTDHDHVADGTYIVLLTRNGGGNREEYESSFESLQEHPNYVTDWDCDWDRTYAEICFSIPEEHVEEVTNMLIKK